MIKVTLGIVLAIGAASPLMAGHANPWATEGDIIKEKFHDTNQTRSEGTPGQDEMRGNMFQNVSSRAGGGLGGAAPQDGTGHRGGADAGGDAGHGGGNGGGNGGGGGHGGGGHGGGH